MNMIVLSIMLAVTVEGVVEIAKSIGKAALSEGYKTAVTQVVALALGCALCLAAGADVYGALGVHFATPQLGMVLTGVLSSRGSNYVSDFIKRLQNVSATAAAE